MYNWLPFLLLPLVSFIKFYSLVVNVTVSKGFMEDRWLDATNMKWKQQPPPLTATMALVCLYVMSSPTTNK